MPNAFCSLLDIKIPIAQAGMGGATSPELVAAVSNAGGLGLIGLSVTYFDDLELVRQEIRRTRSLTQRPFGANIILEWDPTSRLDVCLDEGVRLVSFSFGDPAPYVKRIHDAGALVSVMVGTPDDAKSAIDAGVDLIIAQGWEAGAHPAGHIATMALVPAVVDAVEGRVPVLAAGGIADGRGAGGRNRPWSQRRLHRDPFPCKPRGGDPPLLPAANIGGRCRRHGLYDAVQRRLERAAACPEEFDLRPLGSCRSTAGRSAPRRA